MDFSRLKRSLDLGGMGVMPYPEIEDNLITWIECSKCVKLISIHPDLEKCPYCGEPVKIKKKPEKSKEII